MGFLSRFKRKKVSTKGFTSQDKLLAKAVREEQAAKSRERTIMLQKRVAKAQARGRGGSGGGWAKAASVIKSGIVAANRNMMGKPQSQTRKAIKKSDGGFVVISKRGKEIADVSSYNMANKIKKSIKGSRVIDYRLNKREKKIMITEDEPKRKGQFEQLGDTFDFMGGLYG